MALIGYARVSTLGQNYSRQIEALKAAGATTIYREKKSGARADRPQLAKLMASLKAGDIVVVTKLDIPENCSNSLTASTRPVLLSALSAIRYGIRLAAKASFFRRCLPPLPTSSGTLSPNAQAKAGSELWPLE